jgi:hypothetical protein
MCKTSRRCSAGECHMLLVICYFVCYKLLINGCGQQHHFDVCVSWDTLLHVQEKQALFSS